MTVSAETAIPVDAGEDQASTGQFQWELDHIGLLFGKDWKTDVLASDTRSEEFRGFESPLNDSWQLPAQFISVSTPGGTQIIEAKSSPRKSDGRQFSYDANIQLSGGQRERMPGTEVLKSLPQIIWMDESFTTLDVTIRTQILRLINDLQTEAADVPTLTQRQRSALARVMRATPKILMNDPFTSLDVTIQMQIFRLIKDLQSESDVTTAIPRPSEFTWGQRIAMANALLSNPTLIAIFDEHAEPSLASPVGSEPDSLEDDQRGNIEPIRLELEILFREGRDEIFEDGMESTFSRRLESIICTHGPGAIDAMSQFLIDQNIDVEVAGEALRQLGLIKHAPTWARRLEMLSRVLLSSTIIPIRDAASLGLSFMDDPAAIPPLRAALERETSPIMKRNLKYVLEQFERTS